jgi:hypothetical protein
LPILRLLGRRRRRLALIRRRGSRRTTVSPLLGRRPVAERVRERHRAERGQGGHDHEIPRSPATKELHDYLQPSCALSRWQTIEPALKGSRRARVALR